MPVRSVMAVVDDDVFEPLNVSLCVAENAAHKHHIAANICHLVGRQPFLQDGPARTLWNRWVGDEDRGNLYEWVRYPQKGEQHVTSNTWRTYLRIDFLTVVIHEPSCFSREWHFTFSSETVCEQNVNNELLSVLVLSVTVPFTISMNA